MPTNAAHWHLILNHVPIIGIPIGLVLYAWGWGIGEASVRRVAQMLLCVFGLVGIPVYYTGRSAEGIVEDLGSVPESILDRHEEMGEWTAYLVVALALMALVGLVLDLVRRGSPGWFRVGFLLYGIVVVGLLVRTASLGGRIRHPEIRSGPSAPAAPGGESAYARGSEGRRFRTASWRHPRGGVRLVVVTGERYLAKTTQGRTGPKPAQRIQP